MVTMIGTGGQYGRYYTVYKASCLEISKDILKDAEIKDGLPQLNRSKMIEVLKKYGFKSVTQEW